MAKSQSSRKHIFINIGVLFCGVLIGFALSFTRPEHGQMLTPTADCSSVAAEPSEEILGAPVFKHPGVITSSKDGLILVRWDDVKGAHKYHVRVWDEAGKEVKNFDTSRTFTFLKNLPVDPKQKETPYWVMVTSLGEHDTIRGKDSERKQIAMLPLRNLDPPTIKSIHTEQEEQPTN
jgi:hypothetical protein